jgi:CRISPR-associated exonuclease Cas4
MTAFWIVLLLCLAAGLYLAAYFLQKKTGLPGGRVVYSDTRMWGQPLEKPLFDGSLAITGKPDYLIQTNDELIPVEVKSSRAPSAPYDTHIYQLAIYCLLVEKVYQKTPPYGLIRYPGKSFKIDFTPELRQETLHLISEMHQKENWRSIPRQHEEPARCRSCGYRDRCDQALSIP